jgi:hypothetical protein
MAMSKWTLKKTGRVEYEKDDDNTASHKLLTAFYYKIFAYIYTLCGSALGLIPTPYNSRARIGLMNKNINLTHLVYANVLPT